MRLRAIWIIPLTREVSQPLFSRRFPTVEACCKSSSGDAYISIPSDEDFVKALRIEIGIDNGGTFVESRDRCNKHALYPAFELTLEDKKSLWPVVVMENPGLIYSAVPLLSQELYAQTSKDDISLADVPGVSAAIEALTGLAQCAPLTSSMTSLNPTLIFRLHQFVSTCLPFGMVTSSNPALVTQLLNPVGKGGKPKQPAWNPVPNKVKSQITVHIKEEVRCIQFNHAEMRDVMDVYGTVLCKAEVEGMAPEICITLVQPGGNDQTMDGGGITVSPAVSNVESTATTSRLRFRPCNNQPLCHYTLPHMTEPPIHAAFKLRVNNSLVTLNVQLQLQMGVKNQFQQLEVHIPFAGLQMSSNKPSPSVGSVSVQTGNILVWNVGNKFPAKSLNATLNAVCKLKRPCRKEDGQNAEETENIGWEQYINCCALVLFKMSDYTFSGTKVDPQSITVSTASKVRCLVTSECVSGQYKIWNSEGEVPTVTDLPILELQDLLIEC